MDVGRCGGAPPADGPPSGPRESSMCRSRLISSSYCCAIPVCLDSSSMMCCCINCTSLTCWPIRCSNSSRCPFNVAVSPLIRSNSCRTKSNRSARRAAEAEEAAEPAPDPVGPTAGPPGPALGPAPGPPGGIGGPPFEPEAAPGPVLGGGGGPEPEPAPVGTRERWLPYILADIERS